MSFQCIYAKQKVSPPLFLEEVLSSCADIEVSGVQGRIHVPGLNKRGTEDRSSDLAPPKDVPESLIRRVRFSDRLFRWGNEVNKNTRTSSVRAFYLEFEIDRSSSDWRDSLSKVNHKLDPWFSVLRDWLEVQTKQDLSVDDPEFGAALVGVHNWADDGDTEWQFDDPMTLAIRLSPQRQVQAISAEQWEKGLQ